MAEEAITDEAQEQAAHDPPVAVAEVAGEGHQPRAETAATSPALSAEQLGRLRAALIAANPEAVPELIAGADFDTLLASVEPARAVYARVRDEAAQRLAAEVPRGGGVREIDPAVYADLSPEAKIAAALGREVR